MPEQCFGEDKAETISVEWLPPIVVYRLFVPGLKVATNCIPIFMVNAPTWTCVAASRLAFTKQNLAAVSSSNIAEQYKLRHQCSNFGFIADLTNLLSLGRHLTFYGKPDRLRQLSHSCYCANSYTVRTNTDQVVSNSHIWHFTSTLAVNTILATNDIISTPLQIWPTRYLSDNAWPIGVNMAYMVSSSSLASLAVMPAALPSWQIITKQHLTAIFGTSHQHQW